MKLKRIVSVAAAVAVAVSAGTFAVGCSEPVKPMPPKVEDYARTYYEIFVRSFADGNGDGVGDLRGLINNLDYLNDGDPNTTSDLGVDGIWLMPINPSPSYHKYDVEDYYDIDREYGSLGDFDELVRQCNKRGIWIQMDLVLNHSSGTHPWFKEAIIDAQLGIEPEDSVAMSRYSFVHGKPPSDGGKWRPVSGAPDYYYLGNFSDNMPDINLANEDVWNEITRIVDFWLERGVRSFRLDAVPWAFANDVVAGKENIAFWTKFNDYCNKKGKEVYGDEGNDIPRYCYNVGEVYGNNACIGDFYSTGMSNFNYVMGGDASGDFALTANGRSSAGGAGVVSRMCSLQSAYVEKDKDAIISNFLSNHDNPRSAGYFLRDPDTMKHAAALYLLAPGSAYIYYGEEIGAAGSGDQDENYRLHFNWGKDDPRNTEDPKGAKFKDDVKLGTMLDQTKDRNSVLSYYRKVIDLRNRHHAIGAGRITGYALDGGGNVVTMASLGEIDSFQSVNALNEYLALYSLTYKDETIFVAINVGESNISVGASALSGYAISDELYISGGKASFKGGTLSVPAGGLVIMTKE